KAIAQNPSDAALYNDLGLTLSKLGQHDMASQTLQRALDLAPGTSRYANNLASIYFESGKTDDALKVLKANNKPAVAHFNMAFLHYKKGQQAQAQAQLNQSLAHEHEATSDPATKRAIDRSREMLAQLNPGATTPAVPSMPQGTPSEIGPAAGPAAIIAAAPAHRSNQSPQVLGQTATQPVVPGSMTPVSYQDPRSYMSPQAPAGATAPSSSPETAPATSPTATPPTTGTTEAAAPATTAPAQDAPAPTGFTLPGGFTLPNG
ncbi:tetratricopeptide repeat protein, partial [Rhodopirellula sallentina]